MVLLLSGCDLMSDEEQLFWKNFEPYASHSRQFKEIPND